MSLTDQDPTGRLIGDTLAATVTDPLRIAVDVTPLIGNRTGIGVFTAGLSGALALRDDVTMRRFAVTWRARAGAAPDQLRPMPARPLRWCWRRFEHPPIEWFTGPVDVVHGTNFVAPPTRRAATVVSVHDLTSVRFPQLCTPDTLQHPALIRRAIDRGAFIHTDTRAVADEVISWSGIDPSRVCTVHPGLTQPAGVMVDPPRFGAPYILALGTIEPRKDHPLLLRAFAEVARADPDVLLVVAGADGWGTAAFDRTLGGLDPFVRARVRRLGWVSDEQRSGLLANAALFAYPSVYEGFGFPPLEAMAHGVPVVGTRIAALVEVLGAAAHLVEPTDSAFGEAMGRLLVDSTERTRLQVAGRATVARYRWDRCAAGIVELYRQAATS